MGDDKGKSWNNTSPRLFKRQNRNAGRFKNKNKKRLFSDKQIFKTNFKRKALNDLKALLVC